MFGDLLVDQGGAHETRANDVCAHAMLGALLRDHLGEADQSMLGGHVGPLQHRCLFRVHRPHIDDAATRALFVHPLQHGAGGEKRAVEVDAQKLLPVRELEFIERGDDLDAGIAHEHVDLSELLDRACHAGLDLLFVRHVHDDADRLAGVAELRRRRVGGLLIQIGDHDLCALAGEGGGDLLADAAGGAGHDGNFVLETHVMKLPRWQVSAPARASRRPAADSRRRPCRGRA